MNWTEKLRNLFRHETGDPEIAGPALFQGHLHFARGGKFDASLMGKITSRNTLLIGANAGIEGDLRVADCQIQGRCEGRIDASGSVRVDSTGIYIGKMTARSLRVEPGSEFQSEITIEPQPQFDEAVQDSILVEGQGSAAKL